jgi:hypothetical protein
MDLTFKLADIKSCSTRKGKLGMKQMFLISPGAGFFGALHEWKSLSIIDT